MKVVENFPGSENVFSLRDFLVYYPEPPIDLQFIVDIPTGSKVRYPDLVNYPLQDKIAVPPELYCVKFPPPPSGALPMTQLECPQ